MLKISERLFLEFAALNSAAPLAVLLLVGSYSGVVMFAQKG